MNVALGLNVHLSLHLHPYFVYASSKGSGETAHLRRLTWALVARQCDTYQKRTFLLAWLSVTIHLWQVYLFVRLNLTFKAPRKKNASENVVCWSRLLQIIV